MSLHCQSWKNDVFDGLEWAQAHVMAVMASKVTMSNEDLDCNCLSL